MNTTQVTSQQYGWRGLQGSQSTAAQPTPSLLQRLLSGCLLSAAFAARCGAFSSSGEMLPHARKRGFGAELVLLQTVRAWRCSRSCFWLSPRLGLAAALVFSGNNVAALQGIFCLLGREPVTPQRCFVGATIAPCAETLQGHPR